MNAICRNHNIHIQLRHVGIRCASTATATVSKQSWRTFTPNNKTRKFSPIKTHLYAQYLQLMQKNSLLLLLSHTDFPAHALAKLRRQLVETTLPKSPRNPFGVPKGSEVTRSVPQLVAVRTHMLTAAMREVEEIKDARRRVVPLLQGPIAVLSLPALDPPHLASVLKVLERALPKSIDQGPSKTQDDPLAMPPPGGGGVRKPKPPPVPALQVLGGLVEGRLFEINALKDVTKLPPLQVLHSQIIGLLSSPASQLVGILGQASGGNVVRTLDGFRQGLEDASSQA